MLQIAALRIFALNTMQAETEDGIDGLAGAAAVLADPIVRESTAAFGHGPASAAVREFGMLLFIAAVSFLSIGGIVCATRLLEPGTPNAPAPGSNSRFAQQARRAMRQFEQGTPSPPAHAGNSRLAKAAPRAKRPFEQGASNPPAPIGNSRIAVPASLQTAKGRGAAAAEEHGALDETRAFSAMGSDDEQASTRGPPDGSLAAQQRRRPQRAAWRGWRGRPGGQAAPYPSGVASEAIPEAAGRQQAALPEDTDQHAGGALFTVPVEDLVCAAEQGGFLLTDVLSSMRLRAVVSQNDKGVRKVQIFSGENAVSPWASVGPAPASPGCLELRSASGQQFVSLTVQGDRSFVVSTQALMKLVIEGSEECLDLHFLSYDGRVKATVACKEVPPGGPEQVEINVSPGIDPVLIVVCTLAIMFLCGEGPEEEHD